MRYPVTRVDRRPYVPVKVWLTPIALSMAMFGTGTNLYKSQSYPVSGYSVAVTVRTATSGHTTVAHKINWVMFSDFQAIYSLTMVCLLWQRPPNNGMIIMVLDGFSTLPTIQNFLLSVGITSSKKDWKRYLTNFLITSQSTHVSKAVRSLNLAFPPKNSSFLDHLLMIRIKGMGNYVKLFWKYAIPPCPFLDMAHFSFL